MKKRDFDNQFKELIAEQKRNKDDLTDEISISIQYTTYKDNAQESGKITQKQYNEWCCPIGAYSERVLQAILNKQI